MFNFIVMKQSEEAHKNKLLSQSHLNKVIIITDKVNRQSVEINLREDEGSFSPQLVSKKRKVSGQFQDYARYNQPSAGPRERIYFPQHAPMVIGRQMVQRVEDNVKQNLATLQAAVKVQSKTVGASTQRSPNNQDEEHLSHHFLPKNQQQSQRSPPIQCLNIAQQINQRSAAPPRQLPAIETGELRRPSQSNMLSSIFLGESSAITVEKKQARRKRKDLEDMPPIEPANRTPLIVPRSYNSNSQKHQLNQQIANPTTEKRQSQSNFKHVLPQTDEDLEGERSSNLSHNKGLIPKMLKKSVVVQKDKHTKSLNIDQDSQLKDLQVLQSRPDPNLQFKTQWQKPAFQTAQTEALQNQKAVNQAFQNYYQKGMQLANLQRQTYPVLTFNNNSQPKEAPRQKVEHQHLRQLIEHITKELNISHEKIDMDQLTEYIAHKIDENFNSDFSRKQQVAAPPGSPHQQHQHQQPPVQPQPSEEGLLIVQKKELQVFRNSEVTAAVPLQNIFTQKSVAAPHPQNPQLQISGRAAPCSQALQPQAQALPELSRNSSQLPSPRNTRTKSSLAVHPSDSECRDPKVMPVLQKQDTKSDILDRKKKEEKKRPENRVTIWHEFVPMHEEHPVNKAISWINQIVRLIFKNTKDSQAITVGTGGKIELPKTKGPNEDRKFLQLAQTVKQLGLSIPKKFDSKLELRQFFYSREFILALKIKMAASLHAAILQTSHQDPEEEANPQQCTQTVKDAQKSGTKRFFVGRGNNSRAVVNVLKQRYWWQPAQKEDFAECDFIWTGWKQQKHIDYLMKINASHYAKMAEVRMEPPLPVAPLKIYNKLEQNKQLSNKKGIFVNMHQYYSALGEEPFKVLPLTFHTKKGVKDPQFLLFVQEFQRQEHLIKKKRLEVQEKVKKLKQTSKFEESDDDEEIAKLKRSVPKNYWIIKPGENTNRGNGIEVSKSLQEIKRIIQSSSKSQRTYIIQKYIDNPLLVNKRKFDFRVFGLLTSTGGSLKGYFYEDGYVRTSSKEFSLDDVQDKFVHLTNDAIQAHADDYGKFESGNKLAFSDFTKVMQQTYPQLDFDMYRDIMPQIKKLVTDTFRATCQKIDPARLQNSFELFGYDFMLDENFKLYLIEVNTNPSLEVCCALMSRLVPDLLDNTFRIALDPFFPSPDMSANRKFQLNELPQEVKFSLVFDEDIEGQQIQELYIRAPIAEEEIESDKENELIEDDLNGVDPPL